jgi:4-amino-4-deoxy-L-arabinose transferase-like glycosyltransferase
MRPRSDVRWALAGAVLVALAAAGVLAYLLRAYPYSGLYGIDAYAYAGQSTALLRQLSGQPDVPGALFGADGLPHWPIGYHLHLMLGRLVPPGGIEGGRLLTLAIAVGVPVLTYLLAFHISGFLTMPARAAAGLVAASALLLTATFTRTGTSIMSDVPAMFWALLACVLTVWGWPPSDRIPPEWSPGLRAALVGAALGMAVLVRYASVLIAVPIIAYLLLRSRASGATSDSEHRKSATLMVAVAAAVAAFALALLPQAVYLLTHEAGPEGGTYVASMSAGNILSRSSTGPDGPPAFPHTMLEFYTLSPLWDAAGGFLSVAFVPVVLLGLLLLIIRRRWAALALLLIWWLVPAIAYAMTPYQTHRYALVYLPAIATLAGLGAASGVEGVIRGLRRRSRARTLASVALTCAFALLLAYGALQGWRSVRDWQATHSAWQAADKELAQAAVAATGARAVCFPACAPLDFYAGMPALDLYNNDEAELAAFIQPGSTIAVMSEQNIATRWAGTDVAIRRKWLSETYALVPAAQSGEYTVYRIRSR